MNSCPYCKEPLEKPLKRRGDCPNCKKTIFVRNGLMVTEYESLKIDWLKRTSHLGADSSSFELTRKKLTEKFNKPALFNDICWGVLNNLVGKNLKNSGNLKTIYLEMARILEDENKDNTIFIIKANQIDLLDNKKSGYKYVKVMTCNDDFVCEECRKLEKEIIPIDKAIELNPIPTRCKNKQCRCWYGSYGSLLDNF